MSDNATQTAAPAAANTLDEDIIRERHYYAPKNLQNGAEYLQKLMGAMPETVKFHFNFDPASPEIPDGFGLLIQPMLERAGKGQQMKLVGFVAAAVPDVATVVADVKGAAFLENALTEVLGRKLKGIISGTEPGEPIVLPTTLAGFIERATRSEGVASFNNLAKGFVTALRDAKFQNMNKDTLRSVLMSAPFATALYPKIPQKVWEALLDQMADKAEKATPKMDGAIFKSWKATRNERSFGEIEEVDLSSLGITL